MTRIFADTEFAIHQSYRSAMILDTLAKLSDTKIIMFGLEIDGIDEDRKIKLFEQFENIEYITVPNKEQITKGVLLPDDIKSRPPKARDNSHPGAEWQYCLYHWVWEYIKQKGIDKKLSQ